MDVANLWCADRGPEREGRTPGTWTVWEGPGAGCDEDKCGLGATGGREGRDVPGYGGS